MEGMISCSDTEGMLHGNMNCDSHSIHDSRKNCALAHMRYYEIAKISRQLEHRHRIVPIDSFEWNKLRERTNEVVSLFLTHHLSDKDVGIFQSFYESFLSDIFEEDTIH